MTDLYTGTASSALFQCVIGIKPSAGLCVQQQEDRVLEKPSLRLSVNDETNQPCDCW